MKRRQIIWKFKDHGRYPLIFFPNSKCKGYLSLIYSLSSLTLFPWFRCEHRVLHTALPHACQQVHCLSWARQAEDCDWRRASSRQRGHQAGARHYLVHCPAPRCVPLLLQRKSRNETEKRKTNSDTSTKRETPLEKQQKKKTIITATLPELWFVSLALASKLLTSV